MGGRGSTSQGGAGLGVAESLLCLQEVSFADQDGGDGVPEAVQAHIVVAVSARERGEPVAQGAGAEPLLMVRLGGEQPWSERRASSETVLPDPGGVLPELRGAGAEGDPPAAAGLGGGDDLGGHPTVDVQHPAVQVARPECDELTAAGAAVRGEPE